VDHLHGGFFPCYRAEALRRTGSFRSELFFGFEELDLGLRLTLAGYSLYVSGQLWTEVEPHMVHSAPAAKPSWRLSKIHPRRYYSLRNLLSILLDHGFYTAALRWAFMAIAKPMLNVVLNPRLALKHLRLNVSAIRDAFARHLGETVVLFPDETIEDLTSGANESRLNEERPK
jgi:GT2 family glycosyltransferase